MNGDAETLGEALGRINRPSLGGAREAETESWRPIAEGILTSDWLAAHDAAIRAQALRDAADEMPWPVTSPRAWLRGRAMAVEDAPTHRGDPMNKQPETPQERAARFFAETDEPEGDVNDLIHDSLRAQHDRIMHPPTEETP